MSVISERPSLDAIESVSSLFSPAERRKERVSECVREKEGERERE
jgi:hypothetical protein